ncbi:MAG: hypothetical protein MZV63_30745 [Marinilabiliales bacterium]|nr:hypothetical protein [Marinilabiliales bacterium]
MTKSVRGPTIRKRPGGRCPDIGPSLRGSDDSCPQPDGGTGFAKVRRRYKSKTHRVGKDGSFHEA